MSILNPGRGSKANLAATDPRMIKSKILCLTDDIILSVKNAIILFLITLAVYGISSRGEGANWNYFTLLSDAFLNGRLHLLTNPPWLNELISYGGKYYVVYPPMPAILMMPFTAIFGQNFYQPAFSILLGAVNVFLAYFVFLKIFKDRKLSVWMGVLYSFGTMQWYHAEVGSAWYLAHITALFFLWLMLWEIFTRQRLFLIGLFIGGAYLSRLPAALSIVFVLLYLHERFIDIKGKKILFKNLLLLGLGLVPFILFNFAYNYLRFGVIYDIAYSLLPIFNEPWYRYGLFNIRYIPVHLKEIFAALPKITSDFPYIVPSLNVMALWLVTPVFLLIPLAKFKKKIIWASLVSVLVMSIPGLAHGENGFTQFGFRFALDYLPFLLIITASAFENRLNLWAKGLIILSILINLWGVLMISFIHRWQF